MAHARVVNTAYEDCNRAGHRTRAHSRHLFQLIPITGTIVTPYGVGDAEIRPDFASIAVVPPLPPGRRATAAPIDTTRCWGVAELVGTNDSRAPLRHHRPCSTPGGRAPTPPSRLNHTLAHRGPDQPSPRRLAIARPHGASEGTLFTRVLQDGISLRIKVRAAAVSAGEGCLG